MKCQKTFLNKTFWIWKIETNCIKLEKNKKEIILVTWWMHFYINDNKREIWIQFDELQLWKKKNSRSIIVNKFLYKEIDLFKLNEDQIKNYSNILGRA